MYILFLLFPLICGANVPRVFKESFDLHNSYRLLHHVAPLKWNTELANRAQEWADIINLSNTFTNGMLTDSKNRTLGQNIGATFLLGHQDLSQSAVDVVNIWYSEKINYDYTDPQFSLASQHFTQMIWNNTQYIGFGISNTGPRTIIVANYFPPGNIKNEFESNVF
jgi:hypothetical protein